MLTKYVTYFVIKLQEVEFWLYIPSKYGFICWNIIHYIWVQERISIDGGVLW